MTKGLSTKQFLNSSSMIFNSFLFYANIFTLLNSLTHAHDGQYLAEVTANCLKWFQLDKFVRQFFFQILPLISKLYCSFWDFVWTMQITVIILQKSFQNLYQTSGAWMPIFSVCVVLLISLPRFVISTSNSGLFQILNLVRFLYPSFSKNQRLKRLLKLWRTLITMIKTLQQQRRQL